MRLEGHKLTRYWGIFSRLRKSGFTPVELLFVLALLTMLGTLLLAMSGRAQATNKQALCIANLQRIGQAMQMYTEDFHDTFPGHRRSLNPDGATLIGTNWWGATILGYLRRETNTFHCPVLTGPRVDRGVRWQWGFDINRVGYGFNAFFLGLFPYTDTSLIVGGTRFLTQPWFKRSNVLRPAETLLVADTQPYGSSTPVWSGTLWWPNACMNTKASLSQAFEGVATDRHGVNGIMVFSDGHTEARPDGRINPPVDPTSGLSKGLINSKFWDPLQRGGNQ